MISFQVLDVDFDSVREERYDVSLFASGYESRCIHVPGLIDPSMVAYPLVFGFKEESTSGPFWKKGPCSTEDSTSNRFSSA